MNTRLTDIGSQYLVSFVVVDFELLARDDPASTHDSAPFWRSSLPHRATRMDSTIPLLFAECLAYPERPLSGGGGEKSDIRLRGHELCAAVDRLDLAVDVAIAS